MCGNLFFCRQFKRRTLTARFVFSGLFALCGVKPRGQRVFTQTDVRRTARVSQGVRGLGFDAVAPRATLCLPVWHRKSDWASSPSDWLSVGFWFCCCCWCWLKCCFTSTETVGLLGSGAPDVHLDFHTAPQLWCCCFFEVSIYSRESNQILFIHGTYTICYAPYRGTSVFATLQNHTWTSPPPEIRPPQLPSINPTMWTQTLKRLIRTTLDMEWMNEWMNEWINEGRSKECMFRDLCHHNTRTTPDKEGRKEKTKERS